MEIFYFYLGIYSKCVRMKTKESNTISKTSLNSKCKNNEYRDLFYFIPIDNFEVRIVFNLVIFFTLF